YATHHGSGTAASAAYVKEVNGVRHGDGGAGRDVRELNGEASPIAYSSYARKPGIGCVRKRLVPGRGTSRVRNALRRIDGWNSGGRGWRVHEATLRVILRARDVLYHIGCREDLGVGDVLVIRSSDK